MTIQIASDSDGTTTGVRASKAKKTVFIGDFLDPTRRRINYKPVVGISPKESVETENVLRFTLTHTYMIRVCTYYGRDKSNVFTVALNAKRGISLIESNSAKR